VFRDRIYADLAMDHITLSRSRLQQALTDPTFASFKEQLLLDLASVAVQEENQAAISKGARLLLDGRKYTLEDIAGKKTDIGRGSTSDVTEVNDGVLMLETKIGSGRISLEIPFKNLAGNTRASLAREGKVMDEDKEMHAALYEVLLYKSGTNVISDKLLRAWFNQASAEPMQAALAAHVESYYNELVSEKRIALRLEELEKIVEDQAPEPLEKELEELGKELTGMSALTRLGTKQQAALAVVKKRILAASVEEKARLALIEAKRNIIREWNFSGGTMEGWNNKFNITSLSNVDGLLTGEIKAADGGIWVKVNMPTEEMGFIEVEIRGGRDGKTEIYFETATMEKVAYLGGVEQKGRDFVKLRYKTTDVKAFTGNLTLLRIDPINGNGNPAKFEIKSIKILRK
jgi:hypothetical protein